VVGRAGVAGRESASRPVVRARLRSVAALLLLAVTGCSSAVGHPGGATAGTTPSPSPVKTPTIRVGTAGVISYTSPVQLGITDGTFTSVQVSAAQDAAELDGSVSGDGLSWASQEPPKPAAAYRVVASVKDGTGTVSTQTTTFTVAQVPNDKRLSFSVTPDDGTTVGIGQPVVIRFFTPITKRADVEKAMQVQATSPTGQSVTGSWHWLSGQEVHWRPEEFWTPGTKVSLQMKIAGVQASTTRYGRKDYSETFTIGASHVTNVDSAAHRVRVYRDGKLVDDWPSGTGRRGLETYSGTYVVLGKAPMVQMDSCSARITCDKKDPDYYDEKEYWATRITASGTFLHAAGWDGQLGRANVSHGCVHLSDAAAKDFYGHAVIGDVVTVVNSGRGPQERIATQDPGLIDWNLSWSAWTAGSALK
jgi:lipoprotein-anchoring transpeptidase ErfK/SrfK